jgi:hypothetical protein
MLICSTNGNRQNLIFLGRVSKAALKDILSSLYRGYAEGTFWPSTPLTTDRADAPKRIGNPPIRWRFFMSRWMLAAATATLICASSSAALADSSGAVTGGVAGAVGGAVVGGPVGAVVGGVGGAAIGNSMTNHHYHHAYYHHHYYHHNY